MTRKTNFFHSYRGAAMHVPAPAAPEPDETAGAAGEPQPEAQAPAGPAAAPLRKPWQKFISGPRWPRRRSPGSLG